MVTATTLSNASALKHLRGSSARIPVWLPESGSKFIHRVSVASCQISNPCLNGGVCMNPFDDVTQYVCNCTEPFYGKHCEIISSESIMSILPEYQGRFQVSVSVRIHVRMARLVGVIPKRLQRANVLKSFEGPLVKREVTYDVR